MTAEYELLIVCGALCWRKYLQQHKIGRSEFNTITVKIQIHSKKCRSTAQYKTWKQKMTNKFNSTSFWDIRRGRDSSIDLVTTLRAGHHRNHASTLGRCKRFIFPPNHPDRPYTVYMAYYWMDTKGSSPTAKAIGVWSWPFKSPGTILRETVTPNLPPPHPAAFMRPQGPLYHANYARIWFLLSYHTRMVEAISGRHTMRFVGFFCLTILQQQPTLKIVRMENNELITANKLGRKRNTVRPQKGTHKRLTHQIADTRRFYHCRYYTYYYYYYIFH